MSYKIKQDGEWVTIANGSRMFVGTKAAIDAAIARGELKYPDLYACTDDYPKDEDKVLEVHAATNQSLVANTWKKTDCILTVPAKTMMAVRVIYPYSLSYPLGNALAPYSADSIEGEDAFKIVLGSDTSTPASGILFNTSNNPVDYALWIKGRNTATINTEYCGVAYKVLGKE